MAVVRVQRLLQCCQLLAKISMIFRVVFGIFRGVLKFVSVFPWSLMEPLMTFCETVQFSRTMFGKHCSDLLTIVVKLWNVVWIVNGLCIYIYIYTHTHTHTHIHTYKFFMMHCVCFKITNIREVYISEVVCDNHQILGICTSRNHAQNKSAVCIIINPLPANVENMVSSK